MNEIKLDNYNTRFRLIFLDDINHAINQIFKFKPKKNFLIYNLAGKETYNLLQLIKKIKNVLNVKTVKINKSKNKNYKNSKVLNIRKFLFWITIIRLKNLKKKFIFNEKSNFIKIIINVFFLKLRKLNF